jgi:opacity protein-like surface antigen
MFAPHWSAFLEGNYMDFGTRNGIVGLAACPAGVCTYAAKATETTVLVGVNYRFW